MKIEFQDHNLSWGIIRVLFCSEQGSNHLLSGKRNQDSCSVYTTECALAAAVADGVGNCLHAGEGADAAADAVQNLLSNGAIQDDMIREKLLDAWKSKIDYPDDQCCSTIHFAIVTKSVITFGGIGDGMTCFLSAAEFSIITDSCDFANYTYALPNIERMSIKRQDVLEPFIIVMMTDGIANEMDDSKLRGFCRYLYDAIIHTPAVLKEEIEQWVNDLQRKNGDDKTIMLLTSNVGKQGDVE